MALVKGDFVEIEFTGTITDSKEVFDTNIAGVAKEANLDIKDPKPFTLSIGHKMVPPGLDKDLVGKELDKEYTIEIVPEDAFGKRNPQMVRMVPTKHFHEQKIDPVRGMQLSLDGQLAKILSSSGGRTLVDLNNPLAGKKITYNYKINKVITEDKEKINALQDFLFKKRFDFEILEKTATFKVKKDEEQYIQMFAEKIEEISSIKVKAEISEEKKEEKEKEEEKKEESKEEKPVNKKP